MTSREDLVQATSIATEAAVRSPERQAQADFLWGDFRAHLESGRDAASAYRAGLSSAAAICDVLANELSKKNKLDRARSSAMHQCADAIDSFRSECRMNGDREVEPPSDSED